MINEEYEAFEYNPEGEAPCPQCKHSSAMHSYVYDDPSVQGNRESLFCILCREQYCDCEIIATTTKN